MRSLPRGDRDDTGRAVYGDLELIEEVAAEEPVALREIDVVGRDAERSRAGTADLDALNGHEEHVGGARGAFDGSANGLRRADAHAGEHPGVDHRHHAPVSSMRLAALPPLTLAET